METLSNGLVTIANGAIRLVDLSAHPVIFVVALMAAGFAWLCMIELDELDRQGTKPQVGRH